jgi:excinuclease ABC subunit C
LENCEAPCEFKYAQKKYSNHVSDLELILKGKKQMQEFAQKLQNDMKQASDSLDYERAKEIRDTLHRLGSLQTKQKMEYVENAPDEDYFGIKIEEHAALVMSLRQTHGVIRDSNRFSFDLIGDNTFGNFLYQYYTTSPIPKNIIVSNMPENKQFLENALSEKSGFEVKILVPKRGKRKEMISLVMKNINLIQSKGIEPGIYELQERLELENAPKIIECFDISNHGAQYAVGSMSRFVDGKPDKSGYRKFKIKTVSGRDDYAMIAEIVKRRYYRLLEENSELPNLVLIDGGKGQLKAAERSLQSISVKIQCASLAKQNEEVFVPKRKNPIIIPRSSSALKILQYARDEAHRFGVAYNRDLRKLN